MDFIPDNCPRCGLELDSRVGEDGRCPACRYCVVPQALLEMADGTEIPLSASGQSIGRSMFDGHKDARTVSRKHLWVFFNAERNSWCITPVSDARTELNGEKCSQLGRIQIRDGDKLLLGKIQVTVKT